MSENASPQPDVPQSKDPEKVWIKSQLQQCPRCHGYYAHLVFSPAGAEAQLQDVARMMSAKIQELRVPTWIVGPPQLEPADQHSPANMLPVWPETGSVQCLSPAEFMPQLRLLEQGSCSEHVQIEGQTVRMHEEHVVMAAEIHQLMETMKSDEVTGVQLLERMQPHLPKLTQILKHSSPESMNALCETYPGFAEFASIVMAMADGVETKQPEDT